MMKASFRMLIMATAFAIMNGLGAQTPTTATAAPIDPDLTVYNAIRDLVFTDATAKTLRTDIDAKIIEYINMLTSAKAFYTADGTTAPAAAPLKTYYDNIDAWLTAVKAKQTELNQLAGQQTAAKTILTDATGATDLATLNTKISDTNLSAQITWLKANAATELTNFYAKISTAYKGVSSQTKDSLPTYLDSLKAMSGSITTNTAVFGDQTALKSLAAAVTENADAAKNVVNIMNANMSTLAALKTAIETNGTAVKAWRKLKSLMPQ